MPRLVPFRVDADAGDGWRGAFPAPVPQVPRPLAPGPAPRGTEHLARRRRLRLHVTHGCPLFSLDVADDARRVTHSPVPRPLRPEPHPPPSAAAPRSGTPPA